MKIIIGGDVVPTIKNTDLFQNEDIKSILGEELNNIWFDADVRIINLECPYTDSKFELKKTGPVLKATKSTFAGVEALKPDVAVLANNHIKDAGVEGITDTVDLLEQAGIQSVGAGKNRNDANRFVMLDRKNKKIGIYACADYEFSIASESSYGANAYNDSNSKKVVHEMSNHCDYNIVLYHGGKEYYRYPSPKLQEICRGLIDAGANLVICQHSHCIGCEEKYNNSVIIYGQGNFIFNKKSDEFWKSSLLVQVDISSDSNANVSYLPIVQTEVGVKLSDSADSNIILNEFWQRCDSIKKEEFIKSQFNEYSSKMINSYLYTLAGWNKYLIYIDRILFKGKLIKHKYNDKKRRAIWNYVACEAHREILLQGLKPEDMVSIKHCN